MVAAFRGVFAFMQFEKQLFALPSIHSVSIGENVLLAADSSK